MTNTPAPINDQAVERLKSIPGTYDALMREMGKRIIGQKEIIRDLFLCLLAQGHCLMIGVPGLAKTLIVQSLGEILELEFHRIQFTPDLMPSDITGSEILEDSHDGKRTFRFVKGPVFTQLLLADEINRTPPKTQAALLEAMQERRVTVAGQTYHLASPFFVLATQNPVEQEGTYVLPEAQVDRFMFCLKVSYPSMEEEVEMLLRTTGGKPPALEKLLSGPDIIALQEAVRQIHIPKVAAEFAVSLVQATRPHDGAAEVIKKYVRWGAGPRASQYLALAGKACAALDGRFNVAIEDIVSVAPLVLRHRIITNFRAETEQMNSEKIISELASGLRPR